MPTQKVAIVYDWIDKWGGVERLLLALHEKYPHATFYTAHYDQKSARWASGLTIKTSFMQRLPKFILRSRLVSLWFYPYAFESFDLSPYDIVVSVTSSFAKAIITKPSTKHICILLTPTRFLWVLPENYLNGWFLRIVGSLIAEKLRRWDYVAARRPDEYLAISQIVAQRCRKYYGLIASVLYPPFDTDAWHLAANQMTALGAKLKHSHKKYYLVVARLEKYKQVDLVLKTFASLPNETVVVVGSGTQSKPLKKIAPRNAIFLQNLSEGDLASLYTHAEALILPQEEDFGYVSLESQYFGCPVIAYRLGGALETIKEGKSGIFFEKQQPDSLLSVLASFHTISYNLRHWLEQNHSDLLKPFEKKHFFAQLDTYIK